MFHLNLFTARNWFQIPNSYDQLAQDQRQRVLTWSIAPGYQHTFNAHTLLTVNPFVRRTIRTTIPAAIRSPIRPPPESQDRHLVELGSQSRCVARLTDITTSSSALDLKQTRLFESFSFGITDPTFNPVCVDAERRSGAVRIGVTNPEPVRRTRTSLPNPNLMPGTGALRSDARRQLLPFPRDATTSTSTRSMFRIPSRWDISLFNVGLRDDHYDGLFPANGVEPRLGHRLQH